VPFFYPSFENYEKEEVGVALQPTIRGKTRRFFYYDVFEPNEEGRRGKSKSVTLRVIKTEGEETLS